MRATASLVLGLLVFVSPFVSPLAAQRTFIVDAAGGGDFTEIQPAVDLAIRGDIILVRHGEYSGATVSLGIRLLGDPRGPGPDDIVRITDKVEVLNMQLGNSFVMTDMEFDVDAPGDNFVAEGCTGNVYLSFVYTKARISNCIYVNFDRVAAVKVDIKDSIAVHSRGSILGADGIGLTAVNSEVTLVDTEVIRGTSQSSVFPTADLTDSTLQWSKGARFFPACDPGSGDCIQTSGSSTAGQAEHVVALDDALAVDRMVIRLQSNNTPNLLALAASPAFQPFTIPEGTFYLNPSDTTILYAGPPEGAGASELNADMPLPPAFKPNVHKRKDIFDPPPPGSRFVGLAFTLQGAIQDSNGQIKLTTPYGIIF
ncbi:MAG: right-handed parallel beta-helix repeat-containing protein [Planctomycetota bacterium]|jgi:hypothetical protein